MLNGQQWPADFGLGSSDGHFVSISLHSGSQEHTDNLSIIFCVEWQNIAGYCHITIEIATLITFNIYAFEHNQYEYEALVWQPRVQHANIELFDKEFMFEQQKPTMAWHGIAQFWIELTMCSVGRNGEYDKLLSSACTFKRKRLKRLVNFESIYSLFIYSK